MSNDIDRLVARLRQNPADHAAYGALKEAYRGLGDSASLVNLIEGWAGICTDGATACDAYLEAGQLAQEALADNDRAATLYRSAVHRDPYNGAALQRFSDILDEAGRVPELVAFLNEYVSAMRGHPVDRHLMADTLVKLGTLLHTHYQDADRARGCYADAVQFVPDHAEAIYLHRKLAEADGDIEAIARLYAAEAQAEVDPVRRLAHYMRLADFHVQQRGALDDAIAVLRQALSEVPGDVTTMHRLADCLMERAKHLPQAASLRDHRRAGELLYQIGTGLTNEPARALEYALAALAAVPNHDGALDLAEDLAPRLGQADVLPELWVTFIATAGPGPESDRRRLLLARAYAEAGQLDDAIFCLEQMPDNAEAAAVLATLVGQRQQQSQAGLLDATPGGIGLDQTLQSERRPRHPTPSEERRAQDIARVDALRREVHQLITERRQDEAAARCNEIIALDPTDPEAFNFLENYHRKRRAFGDLRDLLLTSTRVPGLSVDSRKLRLREVAVLSETKLHDADAAIAAYQGVVTLDPADDEAVRSLKRLLERSERWDDLVTLLEREAISSTDTDAKAALLQEIARIHRDHRGDGIEYAEALRQLYGLSPTEPGRKALCDAYLSLGQYEEAVALLRSGIEQADHNGIDASTRLEWQRRLVQILDEELQDPEATYAACEALLALRPGELAALDRMERIDEVGAYHGRLLRTLERRAELVEPNERIELLERMGRIADEHLQDVERAAGYYATALSLGASERVMAALSEMYERAGRYDDLARLLAEQAEATEAPERRRELFLRLAQVQAEWLVDIAAAKATYARVLEGEDHPTALGFMVECARDEGDAGSQASYLARLQAVTADRATRRAQLFELASLQELDLNEPEAAVATLTTLLTEVDPAFAEGIDRLQELSEECGDPAGLALALERRLASDRDADQAPEWARTLSDLCEGPLADRERAVAALTTWAQVAQGEHALEPHQRLRPLLEERGASPALVATLDALARLEPEAETARTARMAAADAAFALGDNDGAWARLSPLVEAGRDDAMLALSQVCQAAGWTDRLANLHVELAQRARDLSLQKTHWRAAAALLDRELAQPVQALEAALRGFALDMGDRDLLADVDELAIKAGALERLAQVYDRVVKAAPTTEAKVALLQRHADLLEMRTKRRSEALDQILRAFALDPQSETLLVRAERLADAVDRGEDMLQVYDRRREHAEDDATRVDFALRAARLCDTVLQDRGRAEAYLRTALAATEPAPELAPRVLAAAQRLDEHRPELGADSAQRALVRAHRELAERAKPEFAERLILSAADLLRENFESERDAFDVLRHGLRLLPTNARVYAELLKSAKALRRLDTLDGHLVKLIDETIDSRATVALLGYRGALLERSLKRPQEASQVYSKLLQLRPDDHDVADRLRTSLKRAKRYQDLLVEISKQLKRADTDERRLTLLREAALTWDRGLRNRFEAREAWNKVLALAPEDEEALSASERLGRRKSAPAVEDLFRDDDTTASTHDDADLHPFDDPFPDLAEPDEDEDEVEDAPVRAALFVVETPAPPPTAFDAAPPPSSATGDTHPGLAGLDEAEDQEEEDFDLEDLDAALQEEELAAADPSDAEEDSDLSQLGALVSTAKGQEPDSAVRGASLPPPVPSSPAAPSRAPSSPPRPTSGRPAASMPPPLPPDASRPPRASTGPDRSNGRSMPPPVPKR